MIDPVDLHNAERFRAIVVRRLGLQFEDAKLDFLREVLQRRIGAAAESLEAYLGALETQPSAAEIAALAQELTVNETYFFRNKEQFQAFAEVVLPERRSAQAASRTLRFLSAGCASGEEAYSLSMVIQETLADPSWDVLIRAVDLNPAVLQKARKAQFSAWALRETSPEIQRRWFRPAGRDLVLDESLRGIVKFEERNLSVEDPELWRPASYDAIFCRNVMMYFSPEQARALVARICGALVPGGYLFLGHAETLRSLSDDFHLRHTHGTFYYVRIPTKPPGYSERKGGPGPRQSPPPAYAPAHAPAAAPPAAFPDAWFDTIRAASERVEALIPDPAAPGRAVAALLPAWDLAPAFELMGRERFAEALACVRDLPPESGRDPEILLLEAMLLIHNGELAAAEAAGRRLLLLDELNAGARYLCGLCREGLGDRQDAVEHYRIAVYLDPSFAMPRLHLGLIARRAEDRDGARRELAQALELLKREDASRLLLFGGGFTRKALISLCESALRDCGGKP